MHSQASSNSFEERHAKEQHPVFQASAVQIRASLERSSWCSNRAGTKDTDRSSDPTMTAWAFLKAAPCCWVSFGRCRLESYSVVFFFDSNHQWYRLKLASRLKKHYHIGLFSLDDRWYRVNWDLRGWDNYRRSKVYRIGILTSSDHALLDYQSRWVTPRAFHPYNRPESWCSYCFEVWINSTCRFIEFEWLMM